MFKGKSKENQIIIRACVGCILPHNAILINDGIYKLRLNNKLIDEPYYDYIIYENQLETYIETNYEQLIKYKLIENFKNKNNDKHIDTIQVDSLNKQ